VGHTDKSVVARLFSVWGALTTVAIVSVGHTDKSVVARLFSVWGALATVTTVAIISVYVCMTGCLTGQTMLDSVCRSTKKTSMTEDWLLIL
jgi:hypothetical protein